MTSLTRFGVSVEKGLLQRFDQAISRKGYATRSEAIRDLIRDHLVGQDWDDDRETVGTVSFVYDHHVRDLTHRLTAMQHDCQHLIQSGMHVHLDHDHCLEVLVLRGKGSEIQRMSDALVSIKGVKHGKLTTTTTGRRLK